MVHQTISAQALAAKQTIFSTFSNLLGNEDPVSTNLWIYNREPLIFGMGDMLFQALTHRSELTSEFFLETLLLEPAKTVHAQKSAATLTININIIGVVSGGPCVVRLPIGRDIPLQIPVFAQNELGTA